MEFDSFSKQILVLSTLISLYYHSSPVSRRSQNGAVQIRPSPTLCLPPRRATGCRRRCSSEMKHGSYKMNSPILSKCCVINIVWRLMTKGAGRGGYYNVLCYIKTQIIYPLHFEWLGPLSSFEPSMRGCARAYPTLH